MSWEDRMSQRARARTAKAAAAKRLREDAVVARVTADFPALEGENDYIIDWGPHCGHRTHIHPWHGWGVVTCSCGEPAGVFSYVLPDEPMPEPEPCTICTARGMI